MKLQFRLKTAVIFKAKVPSVARLYQSNFWPNAAFYSFLWYITFKNDIGYSILSRKYYLYLDSTVFPDLQSLAKTWIYHTRYVCSERIFDSRPFMYSKIFLKKIVSKIVAHIFTLLLAPFASKLVNFLRHSESLNNVWKRQNRCFRRKMKSISNSFESLKSMEVFGPFGEYLRTFSPFW